MSEPFETAQIYSRPIMTVNRLSKGGQRGQGMFDRVKASPICLAERALVDVDVWNCLEKGGTVKLRAAGH